MSISDRNIHPSGELFVFKSKSIYVLLNSIEIVQRPSINSKTIVPITGMEIERARSITVYSDTDPQAKAITENSRKRRCITIYRRTHLRHPLQYDTNRP